MAWRDQLSEASFRGVPFFMDDHEARGGRRGTTHEYPQRDEPYAEDTGRRARGYSFQAYVLGPDYMAARDALIEAMDQEGPGTLIHPYLGEVLVQPRNWSLRETTRRGGMATLRLSFDEAGENQFPSTAVASGNALQSSAGLAWEPVLTEFDGNWDVSLASWLQAEAEELVGQGVDSFEDSLSKFSAISGDAGEFTRSLQSMRSELSTLVTAPSQLATEVSSLLVSLASLPSSTAEGFQALVGLGAFSPLLVAFGQSTPARVQQSENETQFTALMRRGATIEAANLVADMSFASRTDARDVRDTITGLLDTEITTAGETGADDVFGALSALYAAVVLDLQARGATLALIRSITLAATEPALTIAHRLYQDASRDQEIIDRNRIWHPGFVPGGVPLEVLTSDG